jgi:hypothetical protein
VAAADSAALIEADSRNEMNEVPSNDEAFAHLNIYPNRVKNGMNSSDAANTHQIEIEDGVNLKLQQPSSDQLYYINEVPTETISNHE